MNKRDIGKKRQLADFGLWEKVRKTVTPLDPAKRDLTTRESFSDLLSAAGQYPSPLAASDKTTNSQPVAVKPVADFTGGKNRLQRPSLSRPSAEQLQELRRMGVAGKAVSQPGSGSYATRSPGSDHGLDTGTKRNLKTGKLAIDATLDLHGMTQAEAHARLFSFIRIARQKNNRIILVITGKGAGGQGALKQAVPLWLEEASMRQMVSGYASAHRHHGGSGALYVRIRRIRGNR